jgi:hypothetical protein
MEIVRHEGVGTPLDQDPVLTADESGRRVDSVGEVEKRNGIERGLEWQRGTDLEISFRS